MSVRPHDQYYSEDITYSDYNPSNPNHKDLYVDYTRYTRNLSINSKGIEFPFCKDYIIKSITLYKNTNISGSYISAPIAVAGYDNPLNSPSDYQELDYDIYYDATSNLNILRLLYNANVGNNQNDYILVKYLYNYQFDKIMGYEDSEVLSIKSDESGVGRDYKGKDFYYDNTPYNGYDIATMVKIYQDSSGRPLSYTKLEFGPVGYDYNNREPDANFNHFRLKYKIEETDNIEVGLIFGDKMVQNPQLNPNRLQYNYNVSVDGEYSSTIIDANPGPNTSDDVVSKPTSSSTTYYNNTSYSSFGNKSGIIERNPVIRFNITFNNNINEPVVRTVEQNENTSGKGDPYFTLPKDEYAFIESIKGYDKNQKLIHEDLSDDCTIIDSGDKYTLTLQNNIIRSFYYLVVTYNYNFDRIYYWDDELDETLYSATGDSSKWGVIKYNANLYGNVLRLIYIEKQSDGTIAFQKLINDIYVNQNGIQNSITIDSPHKLVKNKTAIGVIFHKIANSSYETGTPDSGNGLTVTSPAPLNNVNANEDTWQPEDQETSNIVTSSYSIDDGIFVVPEGTESISRDMVHNCESIYEIHLPFSLKYIEPGAFRDCQNLKAFKFNNGNNTFFVNDGKGGASSVFDKRNIPYSMLYRNKDIFDGGSGSYSLVCVAPAVHSSSLKILYMDSGRYDPSLEAYEMPYWYSLNTTLSVEAVVKDPNTLQFTDEAILKDTEYVFGNKCYIRLNRYWSEWLDHNDNHYIKFTYIDRESSATVYVDSFCNSIEKYSLCACNSVYNVIFTGSKKIEICDFAFYNCENLHYVDILQSASKIGYSAVKGCNQLQEITIPFTGEYEGSNNSHIGYIFGTRKYTDQNNYLPKLLKIIKLLNCNSIQDHAFYNCQNIEKIYFNNSIKNIGAYACFNCKNLLTVSKCQIDSYSKKWVEVNTAYSDNSLVQIGNNAFDNCERLSKAVFDGWYN